MFSQQFEPPAPRENPESYGNAVSVGADGKIVVAGRVVGSNGDNVLVVRLNPNGALDPSFGAGSGFVATNLGVGGYKANAVALQSDGKIVIAGAACCDKLLVGRLNSDGSTDTSFAGGAVVFPSSTTTGSAGASSLAIQGDQKIVVGGNAPDASGVNPAVLIARLNSDGTFDSDFGSGGTTTTQLGAGSSPHSAVESLALQGNGEIVFAGGASNESGEDMMLVGRVTARGDLDPSFANSGYLRMQTGAGTSPASVAHAMAVQSDGKLVIGGSGSDSGGSDAYAVARLYGDGSADGTFGSGGLVHKQLAQSSPGASTVSAVLIAPDGKIATAGDATEATSPNEPEVLVTRLLGASSPSVLAPKLSKVKETHKRWRRTNKLPVISRARRHQQVPRGTTFSFTLNEPGRVTLTFKRGGRVRGKLVFSGHLGVNKIVFGGRLNKKHKLAPGRYVVVITARVPEERVASVRLRFRIVK